MVVSLREGSFESLVCGECGIVFYVPAHWLEARRDQGEQGGKFQCPNGHHRVFAESTLDKVRRERDRLKQEQAWLEDELRAEKRKVEAAKKETKRVKKRAEAALCPCCNRHFSQLERHMKAKHPEIATLPKRALP